MAPPSNSMHAPQIQMQLLCVCARAQRNVNEQKDFTRYRCMKQWLKDTSTEKNYGTSFNFSLCVCVQRNVKEQKDFTRYRCMKQWLKDTSTENFSSKTLIITTFLALTVKLPGSIRIIRCFTEWRLLF